MPKLFISHAAKDAELVEDFVDLLQVGVGIHPDDMFCSSLPGMNIPTGAAFVEYIKTQVMNPTLVVLIISPEFLRSQFCNNEVGATWALSLPIHPLLVPPVDFADVRGVLAGKQVGELNNKESLNDLRDDLNQQFGLTLRTSHWERKRDRFLSKLDGVLGQAGAASTATARPATSTSAPNSVSTSGSWMKLGDRFFRSQRFEHHDRANISVQLSPDTAEEESALNRLRPPEHGNGPTIGFAYQNEGGLVQVASARKLSEGDKTIWSLDLVVQEDRGGMFNESSFNEYSADDIAEMRAGRLLINDPPPKRRPRGHTHDLTESIIFGGSDSAIRTDECVVRAIVAKNRDRLPDALCWARLETVFRLKAAEIVESILDLTLGPLNGDALHVRFRGERASRYQNVASEVIEIEGDCDLS